MSYAIVLKNIHKKYIRRKQETVALNGVTLEIESGKITALLGPNGSGKTTLIKSICSLVQVDGGSIFINGIDVTRDNRFMDHIGCILEGERNVYYYLTVYDNLYYFGKLNGIKRTDLIKKIDEALIQLGLIDKKYNYVSELSRGMQQKVALAILLIKDPAILLLDEPTLGLDVESSLHLIAYFKYLANEKNKTILLTTHQLDLAESISDNVILFQNGRVLSQSSIEELMNSYQSSFTVEVEVEKSITIQQASILKSRYNVSIDNNKVEIFIAADMPAILAELDGMHLHVTDVRSIKKSLQDVFLEATGGNYA